jgi:hypothetical protein
MGLLGFTLPSAQLFAACVLKKLGDGIWGNDGETARKRFVMVENETKTLRDWLTSQLPRLFPPLSYSQLNPHIP